MNLRFTKGNKKSQKGFTDERGPVLFISLAKPAASCWKCASSSFSKFFLIIAAVVAAISLMPLYAGSEPFASGSVLQLPLFQFQPQQVPAFQDISANGGDILIDNFEYWDSPYNHGWKQLEPSYPVYGFGLGYATVFNTFLDLQEGSRVLDVYRPSSIFLIGTAYERHGIFYDLFTPLSKASSVSSGYIDLKENPVLSFKFRAPLGIETWDIFEMDILAVTEGGYSATIRIRPLESFYNAGSAGSYYHSYINDIKGGATPAMEIIIDVGREFLDGSWHTLWLDLKKAADDAINTSGQNLPVGDYAAWGVARAIRILATGRMFRLDDIVFRTQDFSGSNKLDLFEPGPRYAQLFEPYRYLFMADYETPGEIKNLTYLLLDANNFITDQEKIRSTWISDILALDPNYHELDPNHPLYDPNYSNRWLPGNPNFGIPDPAAGQYLGREGFFIDITIPVFSDPELRIGGNRIKELQDHKILNWNITVGGYGGSGIQTFLIQPLPVNPYDGMPTYLLSKFQAVPSINAYGHYHYGPELCLALESALWNSGVQLWPNIAYMDYTPRYFEDLILSIEVTNGFVSDIEAFPVSAVNYPVENNPPITQMKICPQFFTVGKENECLIMFMDPDCFIYSLAQFYGSIPATDHLPMLNGNRIRTDQDQIIHEMTINGMPVYQYGPWMETIIDPESGLTRFTPKFEGALYSVVTCTDNYGAKAVGERIIYCVNAGAWLNHPPVVISSPSSPQITRAGEEFIVTSIQVLDPDGDALYASCNLGSIGRLDSGNYLWTFQSNFPGFYQVEAIFYDIRGGYAIMTIELDVKPWWSY